MAVPLKYVQDLTRITSRRGARTASFLAVDDIDIDIDF